jgi:hypothetical protein
MVSLNIKLYMYKTILLMTVLTITIAGFSLETTPHIKAQCPYSAAAQSTGKITCGPGPNDYAIHGAPGQTITCVGGVRTVTSGGHTVTQTC